MSKPTLQLLDDLAVVSKPDPGRLRQLYESATERLNLRTVDYLTIRDLVSLSGLNSTSLHLLLIAMFSSLAEGSVCLRLDAVSLGKKLTPITGKDTDSSVRSILKSIPDFSELIYSFPGPEQIPFEEPREAYKPLVLVDDGRDRFLYFQKYFAAEKELKLALAAMLSRAPLTRPDTAVLASAVREVLDERPAMLNGSPARLNAKQRLGVILPALNNFVLISGGPGTGKTFTVLTLLRVMVRLGIRPQRIRIAAPTGRAAQKLTDAIHSGIASIVHRDAPDDSLPALQGETIHRLLRYRPARNDFLHNRYNPIPADLVIIDEASMIDIVLLGRLFDALDERTGLVMLGDRNQLPSVEAGAVLADLIPGDSAGSISQPTAEILHSIFPDMHPAIPAGGTRPAHDPLQDRVVILQESYRSEERIKKIAYGINERNESVIDDIPALGPYAQIPDGGVWRIEPGSGGVPRYRELRRMLTAWSAHHYEAGGPGGQSYADLVRGISGRELNPNDPETVSRLHAIFNILDASRILTPITFGFAGTAGINGHFREIHALMLDPAGRNNVYAGAPVIITKNDYARGLFNGDSGVIIKGSGGQYFSVFRRGDGILLYPVESLPSYDLSYAITVHKSQGSEYGHVLFVIPEGISDALLSTEILYTGLTRAKKLAILYADRTVLSRAIQNRTERESGIRLL